MFVCELSRIEVLVYDIHYLQYYYRIDEIHSLCDMTTRLIQSLFYQTLVKNEMTLLIIIKKIKLAM